MSQEDSPRASGFSSPANEPDNSFADILKAQETLFAQTDGILTTIISRPPGEDGQVSFEPKKLETLKEIFTNLKDFFLLFQKRSIEDITTLETALRESKAREMEWKELADLFSQYRAKVTGEMQNMRAVIDSYNSVKAELQEQLKEKDAHIASLQDQLVAQQDILLRVQSTGKRRANLLMLEADIGEEEASILKSIARLRAAVAAANEEE